MTPPQPLCWLCRTGATIPLDAQRYATPTGARLRCETCGSVLAPDPPLGVDSGTVHVPGPYRGGLQSCARCAGVLEDDRGCAVAPGPDGAPPELGGWAEGVPIIRLGGYTTTFHGFAPLDWAPRVCGG